MLGLVVVQKLDLHFGYVHTRGTLALAAFAAYAQVQGFFNGFERTLTPTLSPQRERGQVGRISPQRERRLFTPSPEHGRGQG